MLNTTKIAHILLVEDNPGDVRLTQEAFRITALKHRLHVVTDGAEAIKFLYKDDQYKSVEKPDLILLDLNLPKKDGREVLSIIKSDVNLKTIPIVVLTTSSSESDIYMVYDLNANSYIVKPVDFNKFIDVIKAIENYWFKIVKLANC